MVKIEKMPTSIVEELILDNGGEISERVYFYLNEENDIFVSNKEDDATNFWFTFTKDDWKEIKSFIDKQLGL